VPHDDFVYQTVSNGNGARQNSNMSEDDKIKIIQNAKDIDPNTFLQILEMDDDDDDREFSKGIVSQFFSQAEDKIIEMKEYVYEPSIPLAKYGTFLLNILLIYLFCYRKSQDLVQLSSLGHFLKGSSATLGFTKIQEACEVIQHLGMGKDESGHKVISDPQESLSQIQKKLDVMEADCQSVKSVLRNFYEAPL